jgi:BirA family biotin operon repressor/biotin-[acetyl-CoA-carboxylase] ligase
MPIGPYYADFLCREHRLVIELDGFSHETRTEYDATRSRFIGGEGYRVLRFTNEELYEHLASVLTSIQQALHTV